MKRVGDDIVCEITSEKGVHDIAGKDIALFRNDYAGVYEHEGKKYVYRITYYGVNYFTELSLKSNQFLMEVDDE